MEQGSADSARLLSAIQALDGAGALHELPAQLRRRVFQALALFLELAVRLEDSRDPARLALVVEAHVLSCVARFVHARQQRATVANARQPPWRRWSCGGEQRHCVGDVVQAAVCCFLFQLSRHASTAMLVVKSGLFTVLLDECRAVESPEVATSPSWLSAQFDAQDVAVAVDPYDWSTRALTAALRSEGPTSQVYLLPIGARSLVFLLRGQRLPTNEIDEFCLLGGVSVGVSPPASPERGKGRRKPRRLPSMFTFPVYGGEADESTQRCPVCCPRGDASAWREVAQWSTRRHWAVRAVVLLGLHLPRSSPEGKAFVRDGGVDALRHVAAQPQKSSNSQGKVESEQMQPVEKKDEAATTGNDADAVVIREMALAGLSLFDTKHGEVQTTTVAASPDHQPIAKKSDRAVPSIRPPLREKLQAITAETRRDVLKRKQALLVQQWAAGREATRERVLGHYKKAIQAQSQLLRGLSVLSSGRDHPAAANQSIGDWIDSFLTISKKEQLRREQEAMRQRHLLEIQYQMEERRRRERGERGLMAAEDHDTLDERTIEQDEVKRVTIAQLHNEMRELEAKEDEEKRANFEDAEIKKRREAARAEAQRVQLANEERHRQMLENESMKKEDTYYVQKILREKQLREEQARKAKAIDPVAEQQKRIEQMRRLDEERRETEREQRGMRVEDLLARQRRFLDLENQKKESDRERNARKHMEAEERFLRVQWSRIDEWLEQRRQDEEKQRRLDERRLKRQHDKQWKQWQAAWVSAFDAYGNIYYYNQITGVTQWENPFDQQTTTGVAET